MKMFRAIAIFVLAAIAVPAFAQSAAPNAVSRVNGEFYAAAYAYGLNNGPAALRVVTGNANTGSSSITVSAGAITLADGRKTAAFSTYTPITVGLGSVQETVTPTAVSNCYLQAQSGICTITASFTYVHNQGEFIASGSYGLEEAALDALNASGGLVVIDQAWKQLGGTLTNLVTFKSPGTSVVVVDRTSVSGSAYSYTAAAGSVWAVTTYHLY